MVVYRGNDFGFRPPRVNSPSVFQADRIPEQTISNCSISELISRRSLPVPASLFRLSPDRWSPTLATRIHIADLPPVENVSTEELQEIFGAGWFRPTLEALENRELMASGLTATLSGGLLPSRAPRGPIRSLSDRSTTRSRWTGFRLPLPRGPFRVLLPARSTRPKSSGWRATTSCRLTHHC